MAEPLLSVKLGILVEDDIFDTLAKEVEGIADVVAGLGAVVAKLGYLLRRRLQSNPMYLTNICGMLPFLPYR